MSWFLPSYGTTLIGPCKNMATRLPIVFLDLNSMRFWKNTSRVRTSETLKYNHIGSFPRRWNFESKDAIFCADCKAAFRLVSGPFNRCPKCKQSVVPITPDDAEEKDEKAFRVQPDVCPAAVAARLGCRTFDTPCQCNLESRFYFLIRYASVWLEKIIIFIYIYINIYIYTCVYIYIYFLYIDNMCIYI